MTRLSTRILPGLLALVALAAPAPAGAALPDLVADPPPARPLVEELNFDADKDGVAERMRVMRFNGYIGNAPGAGPLELRGDSRSAQTMTSTVQRTFTSAVAYLDSPAWASHRLYYDQGDGHNHWHVPAAARYSLWAFDGSALVAPAAKVGFCMTDSWDASDTGDPATYDAGCGQGNPTIASVVMGLSPGWVDIYGRGLWYQWVDLSNVAPGTYMLRTDVDPDNVIQESDEANVPAQRPVKVPGWVSHPVEQTLATSGPTEVVLDAEGIPEERDEGDPMNPGVGDPGDDDPLLALGAVEYRIEDAPAHGTLDRPAGVWSTDPSVGYTPSGAPAADTFTYSVREVGSAFPQSPPRTAVTLTLPAPPDEQTVPPPGDDAPSPPPPPPPPPAAPVAISGAPAAMFAGTSARLTANFPVNWTTSAGTITPDGVFTAPALPATAVIRATAADGRFAETAIGVVAIPPRPPLPTACPGTVVASTLGRLCTRRIGASVLVSAVPNDSGTLRVVARRGTRVVKRCRWTAVADRRYGCRFRARRGRKVSATVTLRRTDGRVLTKRVAVR